MSAPALAVGNNQPAPRRGRGAGRPWPPGVSGNPRGRWRAGESGNLRGRPRCPVVAARALLRVAPLVAVEALVHLLDDARTRVRLRAALALLALADEGGPPLENEEGAAVHASKAARFESPGRL